MLDLADIDTELKNDYLLLSCLKSNENGETYLLQSKKTKEKYILKRRPIRYKYRVNAEAQALNALAKKGIPAPKTISVEYKDDSCFLLREYVLGETLEERLQEKGGFSEAELIAIGSEICKQLSVLHNQESPIIHRDIKPQNIVITENNEIQLIDFDAARTFNEEKAHDTHFYGTEQTAAPEQYGFDQSDARTDIFGLAKTLIYLACGSYDVKRLVALSFSREFVSLMNRSVSLLKKERPASAEEFKRVLERCKGSKTRFVKRSLIICVSKCVITLIDNATTAVDNTGLAVKSAVPVFAGIVAASGNITAATVFGFSVSAVSGASSILINSVLMPLTGVILGIGLVSSLYECGLSSLAEGIKKCVVWALGIVTSIFITALSLQTAVSGSTDFLMLKTARFLAASTVPIIGSSLSEATATLTSSLKLIKSTLGVSAIIVILFSTLPQIIINILCSFALSVNNVCADVIGITEPQKCIRTIKAAIDIITAVLVFYTLSLIISVAIMIGMGR